MNPFTFTLRPHPADLPYWASQYSYPNESDIEDIIAPRIKRRGYIDAADLAALCYWKTPRIQPRCASNDESFIIATTRIALTTDNEQLRIEVLMLLSGVAYPMASVILHFCHPDRYPILDFRALWTLGYDTPPRYTFPFWQAYTHACRTLADQTGLSMRDLDRALWAYSKFNQVVKANES